MAEQNRAGDNEQDPGASTQMFRAFVDEGGGPQPAARPKPAGRMLVMVAVAVVVVVAVVLLLVL